MSFKALNNKEEGKVERSYIYSHTTKHLTLLTKSKRSQSALEYMMTYGWAILIIVIVAVILYSMGIFNPSSSVSSTVTGFSGLGSVTAECTANGVLRLVIGDSTGNLINITGITAKDPAITKTSTFKPNSTVDPNPMIKSGSSYTFSVPNICPSAGTHYAITVAVNYTEPGQPLPGPYQSTGSITGSVDSTSLPSFIASFDGTNSYISTNLEYPNTIRRNFSLSLWFSPFSDTPDTFYNGLFDADNGNNGWGLIYWPDSHVLDFWILASQSGTTQDMKFGNIKNDTIYNIVITYQNVSGGYYANGYVDGILVDKNVFRSPITLPMPYGFEIGVARKSQYFFGSIFNIQLYNETLPSNKISSLYSKGAGSSPLLNSNLLAWWPLNGSANDYSGNGNNGVATNVIYTSNYQS